ncbi:MAG: hypothetical protein AABW68_04435 [archaeon]
MMNRKLLLIFSLFTLFVFMGSMVMAESGPGSNSGSDGSSLDAVEKSSNSGKMGKSKIDSFVIKQSFRARSDDSVRSELRIRFKNSDVSDDDLQRLIMARIDAADLERLDDSSRERLLTELRIRIKSDEVTRHREIEVRFKERDFRVTAIREAKGLANPRLSAVARLKLLEADLDGESLLRVRALRERLEAASGTTTATADEVEVEEEIRIRHRDNAQLRGEGSLAAAERILGKLQEFTDRIQAKLAGSDVPRPRAENVLARLDGLESDLADSIESTRTAWSAVQEEDATREEIKSLHREMVQLRVHARHAVSAMHALIQAFKNRPEGNDDISSSDEVVIVEVATVTDAVIEAEVAEVLLETDDSGIDSPSDLDDSDEDGSMESDDSGNDSPSDLDDSDEDESGDDNGGDDQ